jgi:putative sugar O-methyltransferase
MSVTSDPELAQILDDLKDVSDIYQPSPFWHELAAAGVRQLETGGFENFKRTVNTRYFNWRLLGIVRHQFFAVARKWARHPAASIFTADFPQPRVAIDDRAASFSGPAAWLYKTYVAMYAEVIERSDTRGLLRALEEPSLGNPFLVHHRGRGVSQDLCNSIHELYSILGPEGLPPADLPSPVFAEIGAGYGRLAYVILKSIPGARYCIVDIPPALYLSQRYLTTLFPEFPAFRFRPFTSYGEVAAEFESSRIRFIAPHQLELLPPKSVDYFINISSFHEMTVPQVQNYFSLMDRMCRGWFYTKQWRVSRTQINGCTLREHDYPVPAAWRGIYHRQHPIQRMFFDALYEIR